MKFNEPIIRLAKYHITAVTPTGFAIEELAETRDDALAKVERINNAHPGIRWIIHERGLSHSLHAVFAGKCSENRDETEVATRARRRALGFPRDGSER